jgi:hypothetical protein
VKLRSRQREERATFMEKFMNYVFRGGKKNASEAEGESRNFDVIDHALELLVIQPHNVVVGLKPGGEYIRGTS